MISDENPSLVDANFPVMEISPQRIILDVNPKAAEMGIETGRFCWDSFGQQASISAEDRARLQAQEGVPDGCISCGFCQADQALDGHAPVTRVVTISATEWETHWIPTKRGTYLHYAVEVPHRGPR